MRKIPLRIRLLPLLLVFAPAWAGALDLEFHAPARADDPAAAAAMRDLAQRILPVYQDADIERYLADEPVEACPPGAGYRLRKFARKHRAALATA